LLAAGLVGLPFLSTLLSAALLPILLPAILRLLAVLLIALAAVLPIPLILLATVLAITLILLAIIYILVPVVIDVHIAVNVDVAVIHTSSVPVAIIREDRAHGHAGAKGDKRRDRVVSVTVRRIINDCGVVRWHVDDIRLSRHDLHDLLSHIFHNHIRDGDSLLRRSLKCAGLLRFEPHRLNRIHYILVLVHERIAELHRPRNIRVQV